MFEAPGVTKTIYNIVMNFSASGPHILTHNDISNDLVTIETNLP